MTSSISEFYERTVALKDAPGSRVRKVFLAIGGWNDSLGPKYSNMVMNRASRLAIASWYVIRQDNNRAIALSL